ncbi:hypothetical protein CSA_022903 [Cucumis sativus]|uniref:Uncharacterized protein n=2 Tax=Cucumis sativus TaxID=3659 RepID=A0ACB6HBZ4_CUCSA|nr:hypothetical protein CSA_004462 [Cucumis sativus]KAE8637529.1 hypothetical protein CSA_022903 [Cucumis sativus]
MYLRKEGGKIKAGQERKRHQSLDYVTSNSLAKTATNPQLKQRYSSCAESYDEAIGDIENAQKDLALGDFNGVNIVTSGAMTNIGDCQDKFAQPPKDTSLLLKNGKTLNDICSIILVISNLL